MISFAGRMSLMTADTLPISHALHTKISKRGIYNCDHSLGFKGFFGVFLEVIVNRNNTLGGEFLYFCLPVVLPRS
jgi:hypothetical protein